jgi:hypothetical protein
MNTNTNRLAEFIDAPPPPPPPTPVERTDVQREASPPNGAFGDPPPQGRAPTASNAVTHALLAEHIAPPVELLKDDQLYRHIRDQLIEEFKPSTYTENMAVDSITADYVQLVQARASAKALQRPPVSSQKDSELIHRLSEMKCDRSTIIQLLDSWDGGIRPACSPAAARRIAEHVQGFVTGLREYVTPSKDYLTAEKMDDFEREEYRKSMAQWKVVKTVARQLEDQERVTAWLVNETLAQARTLKALRSVLNWIAEYLQMHLRGKETEERLARQLQDRMLLARAPASKQSLQRQRQIDALERAIERKLKSLRRA